MRFLILLLLAVVPAFALSPVGSQIRPLPLIVEGKDLTDWVVWWDAPVETVTLFPSSSTILGTHTFHAPKFSWTVVRFAGQLPARLELRANQKTFVLDAESAQSHLYQMYQKVVGDQRIVSFVHIAPGDLRNQWELHTATGTKLVGIQVGTWITVNIPLSTMEYVKGTDAAGNSMFVPPLVQEETQILSWKHHTLLGLQASAQITPLWWEWAPWQEQLRSEYNRGEPTPVGVWVRGMLGSCAPYTTIQWQWDSAALASLYAGGPATIRKWATLGQLFGTVKAEEVSWEWTKGDENVWGTATPPASPQEALLLASDLRQYSVVYAQQNKKDGVYYLSLMQGTQSLLWVDLLVENHSKTKIITFQQGEKTHTEAAVNLPLILVP